MRKDEEILIKNDKIEQLVSQQSFADAAAELLKIQKSDWPLAGQGYASLKSIKTRELIFDAFKIKIQFNPKRINSTTAKVDEKSIEERECFLCIDNLPKEQKGILYRNDYIILVNPFPIFKEHFTIISKKHRPQLIAGSFEYFLTLGKDLSKYYTLIYNGPKSGASAPDHLHFQAGTKNTMPLDDEFHQIKNEYADFIIDNDDITLTAVDDGLRRFFSIESKEMSLIEDAFNSIYKIYAAIQREQPEPMMNILNYYDEEYGWRIIIFLRKKHRPSFYYLEGENKILISPAAVDLGGVCITPLEEDFQKVTSENIKKIFREVNIGKEQFEYFKIALRRLHL